MSDLDDEDPDPRPIGERRLGYVLKRYPRISETFVASEILELERQGENVVIFATFCPDEPFRHEYLSEVRAPVVYVPHRPAREPIRVLRAARKVVRSDARAWFKTLVASVWPVRRAGLRRFLQATVLTDEMDRAGITHAHAHFATTAARLANLAWRLGGPSYSVTTHAKDVWQQEVRLDHLRDKLAGARFVATVSEANRTYLRSVLGDGVAERVVVVHNAVDVRRLQAVERELEPGLVLSVGRLVPKKGTADLVVAGGRLAAAGVDVRLEILGDGPLRPDLERLAAVEGSPVQFLGSRRHHEVVEQLRRAAVFCLPCLVADDGDRDGLPTAVLEAMALGVPVVTTAVNGLAEAVIDGRTGLVVPERDPDAIAEALRRLLTDPELAARLAIGARRHVEDHFALHASVTRLRQLFPQAG